MADGGARHARELARGRCRAQEERGKVRGLTAMLGVGSGRSGLVRDERIVAMAVADAVREAR